MRAVAAALLGCLMASAAHAQITKGGTPHVLGALVHTATAVITTTGELRRVTCYNPNASAAYVQLFNAATSNVTVGTTAPYDVVPLQATTTVTWAVPAGDIYSVAISAAATTTYNGSTSPGTALVCSFSTV